MGGEIAKISGMRARIPQISWEMRRGKSRRVILLVLVTVIQDVGSMLRIRDVGHSALEPTAVIDALVRNARTVPGAHALRSASLAPSAVAATQQYALVAEAMALQPDELPPLCHCLDLEPALIALRDAQSLDIHTLAEVSNAVEALNLLAKWSEGELARVRCPGLATLAAAAAPPERLATKLGGTPRPFVEMPGGLGLSSDAFPILRSRRAAVSVAEKAVTQQMQQLMADGSFKQQLSEPDAQVQQRDGRWVVPVPPSSMRSLGIEVARSRRGSTVFVEPHQLVGLSSTARAAAASLAATEARLLLGVSLLLRRELGGLLESVNAAASLDGAVARAVLGRQWDGVVPMVGEEGVVQLPEARHPLLALRFASGAAKFKVVGNSVALQAGSKRTRAVTFDTEGGPAGASSSTSVLPQALLLTGPNGGGKSVVLKTVALCAVLCRLGVPLPCAPRSSEGMPPRCDFFSTIVTDLDDSQSVERDASSFTAHIRTCKAALAAVEEDARSQRHTLVVLDEPGAATDPLQGAAIARAVIEALLDAGALVLASTHSDALKRLGLADARIAVGAMALSPAGEPLYSLVLGAVGSSHALDAAAREGLPAALLERAQQLLPDAEGDGGTMRREMEALLVALQQTSAHAAMDREAAARARTQAEASLSDARKAAAAAAVSLGQSSDWLSKLTQRLDAMVARLRADKAEELELLGTTIRALRLGQRDATEARLRALAALGLQPVGTHTPLRKGESLSIVPAGSAGLGSGAQYGAVVEGVVAEDAGEYDASVLVAVRGAPAIRVDRSECATWLIEDNATDGGGDRWAWMAAPTAALGSRAAAGAGGGAPAAAARGAASSKRKRR
jgi:DNA mismatch repair protein MutS2